MAKHFSPYYLNLPFFEEEELNLNSSSSKHLPKVGGMYLQGFDGVPDIIMYLLDNRAIQVGKGGMKDLSFLEKSSTSGPYSDFYKKYISPILKELDLESNPRKLMGSYTLEDFKGYNNVAKRNDLEKIAKNPNTALYKLLSNPKVFTTLGIINNLPNKSLDEVEEYIKQIRDKFKGQTPEKINEFIEDLRDAHLEKGGSQTKKFFKLIVPNVKMTNGETTDMVHYSYFKLPRTGVKPTIEDIPKYLSNPNTIRTALAPENNSQEKTNKQIVRALLAIAKEQNLDYQVTTTGPIQPNNIKGLLKKNSTESLNPRNLRRKIKGRPDLDKFLADLIRSTDTRDGGINPNMAPLLSKNLFLNFKKGGSKPSSTYQELGAGIKDNDFRGFIERKKSEVEGIEENYYIDKLVLDLIEQGEQGDPDPEALRQYFTVDKRGNITMRQRTKSSDFGLRYEHTLPVKAMEDFFNRYYERKLQYFDNENDPNFKNQLEEEVSKIIKTLYTIAYIDMDNDRLLDANYKSTVPQDVLKKMEQMEFNENGELEKMGIGFDDIEKRYTKYGVKVIPLKQLFKGGNKLPLKGYTVKDLSLKFTDNPQNVREDNIISLKELLDL